jgi:hypothetical protein
MSALDAERDLRELQLAEARIREVFQTTGLHHDTVISAALSVMIDVLTKVGVGMSVDEAKAHITRHMRVF